MNFGLLLLSYDYREESCVTYNKLMNLSRLNTTCRRKNEGNESSFF